MKFKLFISAVIAATTFTALSLTAEIHYNAAVKAACSSEGTDAAIENAMFQYGFVVDAYSMNEPDRWDKITALFTTVTVNP